MNNKLLLKICRAHLPEDPKKDFATDKLLRQLCDAFENYQNQSERRLKIVSGNAARAMQNSWHAREMIDLLIKGLEFYSGDKSYISGVEEYVRPTTVDTGRGFFFKNKVGPYGTTAKETLTTFSKLTKEFSEKSRLEFQEKLRKT